ncbi:MAG TPA: hypothetical protein VKE96_30285 [Vicinamibacterales bacterium]|nr:hypothetical protein [Vicinamibacterales bacterium]
MTYLFTRAAAQGLQAFVPVAVLILWLRTSGRVSLVKAVTYGIAAAVPATIVAGLLFARAQQQAQWEAALATMSLALAVWFATLVFTDRPDAARASVTSGPLVGLTVTATTTMIITRQTMEIFTVLSATGFDVRPGGPGMLTIAGALAALATSVACAAIGSRVDAASVRAAIRTFAIGFAAQVGFYGLHEAAEARILPWSAALHAATEPYGPDSEFGQRLNLALLVLASAAAGVRWLQPRLRRVLVYATVPAAIAIAGGVFVVYRASLASTPAAAATPAPAANLPAHGSAVLAFSTPPHLLFRHTHIDDDYGKLGIALLDAADGPRATAALSCERVSFAADRGICLSADRGVTNTYRAILFDRQFKPFATIPLDGSPSRTRVSADGRLGAATVFLSGPGQQHSYAATTFSTKTILIDMSDGQVIADLERFTAFRDGKRFHAADFNYWGVTFAPDHNTFYATLRTGGVAHLVRGDIAKRQFTVLRDGVECPSLSPDGRTIVFKKKVDPRPDGWRYYALDVATLQERPTAATTFVDDQAEWLDNEHVLYAMPHLGSADVYVARTDGSERSRLFMHDAQSPIIVR